MTAPAKARAKRPRISHGWQICRCGHLMLLHDVEDMDETDPLCCVDGCDQRGCREEVRP